MIRIKVLFTAALSVMLVGTSVIGAKLDKKTARVLREINDLRGRGNHIQLDSRMSDAAANTRAEPAGCIELTKQTKDKYLARVNFIMHSRHIYDSEYEIVILNGKNFSDALANATSSDLRTIKDPKYNRLGISVKSEKGKETFSVVLSKRYIDFDETFEGHMVGLAYSKAIMYVIIIGRSQIPIFAEHSNGKKEEVPRLADGSFRYEVKSFANDNSEYSKFVVFTDEKGMRLAYIPFDPELYPKEN